ncbi:MAG: MazG nucleotide pyrophosphohydrolase domain-containing protein [Candidatus Paceibacterota bacterium]|jgi:NTP pyrophosphatase (non-canonical NTP hydrolase)
MTVKEFQSKIIEFLSKWDKKRKNTPDIQKTFNHLIEEIGELSRQYVNKGTGRGKYDEKEVENAIGDIFIQLVMLANLHGLDVEKIVSRIIKEEEKLFKE